MSNQGIFGALKQYWFFEEKPRLEKKNTYFEELKLSNRDALIFCTVFLIIAIALISIALIGGNLV